MTGSTGFNLWRIAPSVYLPTLLYGVGQGAIAPVVVLSARDLGASVAMAGVVAAATGIGQLVGDLPAGALTARLGERWAMFLAALLAAAGLAACLTADSLWLLATGITVTGLAAAVWGLARQTYLTEVVPYPMRARALSTLGGCVRIGMFAGPFIGAGAMRLVGIDGAYWVYLTAVLLIAVLLVWLPEPPGTGPAPASSTVGVIREQLPVLRTLGVAALLVSAVRAARLVAIPLWAQHIGLDAATTSLVFGLSGAVEMFLFYPAGSVMDRLGRKAVAVPSMLLLGLAHLLLPLTGSLGTLAAVAMLMGFGNGLGAGIIMTLGADASPVTGRAQFLGAFRLLSDSGGGIGPLLLASVSALAGLTPALLVVGLTGLTAATVLHHWIPSPD